MGWILRGSKAVNSGTQFQYGEYLTTIHFYIRTFTGSSTITSGSSLGLNGEMYYTFASFDTTGLIVAGKTYRSRFVGTASAMDGSNSVVVNITTSSYVATTKYSFTTSNTTLSNSARKLIGTTYLEEYVSQPPSAPSSITVPTIVKGGETLSISWGSGSLSTRYYLERSVNDGTYTALYNGTSLSYTDTITKGWLKVAYRVMSNNVDGYSSYTTSPTRTVQNFPTVWVNIGGVWKENQGIWVNIGGVWKAVDELNSNIGGVWKKS